MPRQKSLPLKGQVPVPTRMSSPLAAKSVAWSGPLASLSTERDEKAHTIARAYLITVETVRGHCRAGKLSRWNLCAFHLAQAIREGHGTISKITGERIYDELLYCGIDGRIPIFSLTSSVRRLPVVPPTEAIARILCAGLSQNPNFALEDVVNHPSGYL